MEKRWIWPFELLDKLGEGGMGVVYRARYVVDNRHVAVKLLPPDVANSTILSRFERELEILKTLRHPNIVRSFGGVCEGNQHFYAMELVEGGTLDKLLEERGKFSAEVAIQLALQMASGLAYAHERGVVHRDVKPGNFLLTTAGKLKLSDFGLATVEAATKITAAGKTMGTFPYMAPEQIRGRPPVSAQTDLYALGCVIFEMLTGRTPFIGDTPAEVMHKHLDARPPRVSEFAPDCPMGLESLVRDLLQKEPSDRPATAFVVAKRLTDLDGSETRTPTPRPHGSASPASQATLTPPKGILVSGRLAAEALERSNRQKWVMPLLCVALALSVALNFRSIDTTTQKNRAEDLWFEAFKSDRPELRSEAAKAMGELAKTSPTVADKLVASLADSRPTVRLSAIEALETAGPAARSATTALMRIQNSDENDFVRRKAVDLLKVIQATPEGASDRIGRALYWGLAILIAAGIGFVAFVTLRKPARAARSSR
ncbi:MAG TPA: protein kinase [Planctomycetaceae bacterium]|nr:protein kinase [Planctomycetaceae bacterium]